MGLTAISGSLKRSSSNSSLLHTAAALAAGGELTVWESLGDLPYFTPDDEGDERVDSLRRAITTSDALIIATPEYAGGMPGVLKNALDWLVGSGELYGKAVVIVSAAPSADRGRNARRWVEEVVRMQGATVVDSYTVAMSRTDGPPEMADKARELIRRATRELAASASASASASAADPAAADPVPSGTR